MDIYYFFFKAATFFKNFKFVNENFLFWYSLFFSFFTYIRYSTSNRFLIGFFYLPSTLFHELAHFFIGLITFAKPVSFSLYPKKDNNGNLRLGEVKFTNLNFFNSLPTAFAPFLLLVGLYYFDKYFFVYIKENFFYFIAFVYINFIFASGGIPSWQDFKVAFGNVFGIIFWMILAMVGFFVVKKYF